MRRIPAAVCALATLLFLADLSLVLTHPLLAFDLTVERDVQAAPWGPLVSLMDLTNWVAGLKQGGLAAAGVLAAWFVNRRGAVLLGLGSIASLLEALAKQLAQRPRPTPSAVHVQQAVSGYSFPSGHATFFTWFAILLVLALLPVLPRPLRVAAWIAAGVLVFAACLGRVWAGAHWPTDVEGGFLLSLAWSAALYGAAGRVSFLEKLRPQLRA